MGRVRVNFGTLEFYVGVAVWELLVGTSTTSMTVSMPMSMTITAPEPVNLCETRRASNQGVVSTSWGGLIQAAPGSAGGTGAWRTKRSG
jgi:hypothetical protein